jgi:mannose-1-phosphate guanylyltransferase
MLLLCSEDHLVTFGIKPLKPETGYGYGQFEGTVLTFPWLSLEKAVGFLEQDDGYGIGCLNEFARRRLKTRS